MGGQSSPYKAIGGCEGRDGLKKVKFLKFGGTKKSRPKTVSRCQMATSGETAKTREIESFTSAEVAGVNLAAYPVARCHISTERSIARQDAVLSWSADWSGVRNTDRQEVDPKSHVFFEKNGIPAFPNWSRPRKTREKRPSILWKKYRKVKNRRDIPTFFTGTETRNRLHRENKIDAKRSRRVRYA